MTARSLLTTLAVSSLAVLTLTLGAQPATAISNPFTLDSRGLSFRGHDSMAKRKRAAQKPKRCKPRTKPSASPQPTSPSKSDGGNQAGPPKQADPPAHVASSGGKKVGIAWANDNSISIGPFVNGNTKL